MHRLISLFVLAVSPFLALGQLTPDQRTADFRNLADTYARHYAPSAWKRDALKFDLFNLAPWLDRVATAKDDLDFYDILVEYVGSLNDAHDYYALPSTFIASLGFSTDVYEGKVLVDSIDRTRLPQDAYPMEVGDEIISIDGKTAKELLNTFLKYSVAANARSTTRYAATLLTIRPQDTIPRAHEIGENAVVVAARDGAQSTYTIPWRKRGVPVTKLAPSTPIRGRTAAAGSALNWLERHDYFRLPDRRYVIGEEAVTPVFTLPEGFIQRTATRDAFFSGTYEANGVKIGFLRIPSFFNFSVSTRFRDEIAYLQANTDALVLDIMRNPGGFGCRAESTLSYFMPDTYKGMSQALQVSWIDVLDLADTLEAAIRRQATGEEIAQLQDQLNIVETAYRQGSGQTPPQPLCGRSLDKDPARDRDGKLLSYTKPILLLTDEITASASEIFAAEFQDNQRGKIFGMRTMGAGGAVQDQIPVGVYSEGVVSLTFTILVRGRQVATIDYPTAPYIENIGIRPDIEVDYMTRDNLINKGQAFVQAFTDAIVQQAKEGK